MLSYLLLTVQQSEEIFKLWDRLHRTVSLLPFHFEGSTCYTPALGIFDRTQTQGFTAMQPSSVLSSTSANGWHCHNSDWPFFNEIVWYSVCLFLFRFWTHPVSCTPPVSCTILFRISLKHFETEIKLQLHLISLAEESVPNEAYKTKPRWREKITHVTGEGNRYAISSDPLYWPFLEGWERTHYRQILFM